MKDCTVTKGHLLAVSERKALLTKSHWSCMRLPSSKISCSVCQKSIAMKATLVHNDRRLCTHGKDCRLAHRLHSKLHTGINLVFSIRRRSFTQKHTWSYTRWNSDKGCFVFSISQKAFTQKLHRFIISGCRLVLSVRRALLPKMQQSVNDCTSAMPSFCRTFKKMFTKTSDLVIHERVDTGEQVPPALVLKGL